MNAETKRAESASGNGQLQRARICEALIALVAERGYEPTTVEMIVKRAGVTRVDFERHFADRQDCFDQLWEEMNADYIAGLRRHFDGDGPWRDRLRVSAYFVLRYFLKDLTRATFFLVGALGAGELAVARRDRQIAVGIDLMDAARAELPDPDSVPRAQAEAVVGTIYQTLFATARKSDPKRAIELVPQLMYIAVMPYFGVKAAEEELRRGPQDIARYERGEL